MVTEDLVSCIITTYKRPPKVVKRAAQSVLNQTYKNIELIIVDDSPDSFEFRDSVRDMVNSLIGNVKYIRHEVNMGACVARNTGMENANGEFIAYLDDDDEWLEQKIEFQMNVMKSNPDAGMVYCGRYTYFDDTKRLILDNTKLHTGYIFDKLILDNFIGSTSFPLIRKTVLEDVGGFDVNMKSAQDIELWLRISKKYKVECVRMPLAKYHIHSGEQITDNIEKKIDSLNRLNHIYEEYLSNHRKAFYVRYVRLALCYSRVDKYYARKVLWQAFRKYPMLSIDMIRTLKNIYIMKR